MEQTVTKIDLNAAHFMNKSIVLYGASGSGKSTVIRNMLYLLRNNFDQVICFCGNEDNIDFYRKHIPFITIHRNLSDEVLKHMWERQELLYSFY